MTEKHSNHTDNPRVLTGITTTGSPHLGNYVGAINPAIQASQSSDVDSFLFLADYHAMIKSHEPEKIHQSSMEIAATWLALGLDPEQVTFYRQSDVPEIMELSWILTCWTAKGLMNRAHAYKASVQGNEANNDDADFGITMGLFSYPVLMAADILMFNGQQIPVGRDQIQHVEMARDIAQRFNHHYGPHFALPEAVIDDNVAVLQGLDGRKMSKSYNNTIPLFETEKKLKKSINKIKTNLLEPGEPKDADDSTVFQIWQAFASAEQIADMRQQFADGIAWGDAKKCLFELVNQELAQPRERYAELIADPAAMEAILASGAEKARAVTVPKLAEIRSAIGIRPMCA
ncbi:MAG: tryptophan--tRNA ligase [Actinobacteria bacterium TMED172]|nr:tryptophan--tRNA ligase [Cellvibrionales bacterium]OUW33338.1 MAG: tryptophan--tRNA ligase [Actinobacteria bacterium TMED172]